MLLTWNDHVKIIERKAYLHNKFTIKDLGHKLFSCDLSWTIQLKFVSFTSILGYYARGQSF